MTKNRLTTSTELVERAKEICETKITEWIEERTARMDSPRIEASKRYRILKAAKGKCELCGISAKISPIDIDHIVPQSKADKRGFILKDNIQMRIDDERNLQALCFRCNRAKRDTDDTDFRQPREKLVRDLIPEMINSSGRKAIVGRLTGNQLRQSLMDKLVEEYAELLENTSIEEITDMIEVLVSLAKQLGFSEDETIAQVMKKRSEHGGFDEGWFLKEIVDY
ncbi:MAG: hypothetical protein OHK0046_08720 [Anaerolineae bacterium]